MHKYLFLTAFIVASNFAHAQESVNAIGGLDTGTGGTVSFSVGQMVYTTDTKESGSMVQGIQRPYRITTTDIKRVNDDISFKAYPNPSSDDLFLEMNAYRSEKLVYHLYDMQGKLIMTNSIEAPKTQINMRALAVGAYLIQIYNSKNQPIQTIQVIKD